MTQLEYLAGQVYGKKPEPTSLQSILMVGMILAALAVFCGGFYYDGVEAGRREALREVARISNDPATMKGYLQEQGFYMFEQGEIRQLQGQ